MHSHTKEIPASYECQFIPFASTSPSLFSFKYSCKAVAIIWLAAHICASSVITQRVTQTRFTPKTMCPTIVTSERGFLGSYRIQEVCRNVWLTVFLELRISESSSLGDISAQRQMEFPCWVQTKDQTAMLGDCVQILLCVSEFLNCTVTSVLVNTDTDFKPLCVPLVTGLDHTNTNVEMHLHL